MHNINRRSWLTGMAALAVNPALPAIAGEVDPAALRADLPTLRRAYTLLHPGIYRYQTPAQFNAGLDDLASVLEAPASLDTQYLHIARLTAAIKCGHTYGNFYNQSDGVAAQLFERKTRLPFFFTWTGARMVVTDNPLGVDGIVRGSEILSIDGVPVSDIQSTLLPYLRADGSNDAKRRKLLDVQGADAFETFDVFHSLLYPPRRSTLRLRVRKRPESDVRTLNIEPIDRAARLKASPQKTTRDSPDYWTLSFPMPGIAVIKMPGWALYDAKWDWRAKIDDMFQKIAETSVTGLIIDIRENEGGLDCGREILAHLIDEPVSPATDIDRLVRFRSTPEDLRPCLDTWDRSFHHLGEGATDLGNGYFALADDSDAIQPIQPKGPRFKGKVIVLSSAQNSSATFQFIQVMRDLKLASIYGEPTGGNRRGINGGCFFFLRLKNSGLEVDLPLIGQYPKTPQLDTGLLPDVFVFSTIEDIAAERDAVLARAIKDLRG
ncbi:S41 family peptidase [Asticcacaulis sp. 201]|uniref:S41 family peptidase n=1 Tax=Asticcacaulis sp. 201 TaxID=3028787 RepID=UPI0029166AB9|nr:S41 family peptidase [Asticcacaulis sp. 201]MDV6330969.1 S41 family peptidase [Asticcacaulis sp. 201]